MNERIQSLKEQAFVKGHWSEDGERFITGYIDMDKFAQLIVRECAVMAKGFEFAVGRDGLSKTMKEHFGVEE